MLALGALEIACFHLRTAPDAAAQPVPEKNVTASLHLLLRLIEGRFPFIFLTRELNHWEVTSFFVTLFSALKRANI
jgi:hypothetical protein